MEDVTLAWLSGLLEGEGSFLKGPPSNKNQPRIAIQMTDLDIVQKVAALFETKYIQQHRHTRHPEWKPCFSAVIRGSRAMALMRQLRPLMGQRRQQQIDAALGSYEKKRIGPSPAWEKRQSRMFNF